MGPTTSLRGLRAVTSSHIFIRVILVGTSLHYHLRPHRPHHPLLWQTSITSPPRPLSLPLLRRRLNRQKRSLPERRQQFQLLFATVTDIGPVPLSFPAILRNPKLSNRFAHLSVSSQDQSLHYSAKHKKDRVEHEGKRWARRRENAKFTHNPHVTLPTSNDLAHPLQVPSTTFPHPLPPYISRNVPLPSSLPPPRDPATSSAGLFSLSLRGVRRTLQWLEGGTYLSPDQGKGVLHFPGVPVGVRGDIREVGREAGKLVWAVKAGSTTDGPGYGDGGFERYVVHCVARWYGVVSFSKETDGYRLTYLLRPNITRPDPRRSHASRTLDTPPTTDASDFHASDASLSDNVTDTSDVDSLAGGIHNPTGSLSDIAESRASSPASWSLISASEFEVDAVGSDSDDHDYQGFAASMESLSLSTHIEVEDSTSALADTTLTPSRLRQLVAVPPTESHADIDPEDMTPSRARARVGRDGFRALYPRAASSPSPARRSPRRPPVTRKMGGKRTRGKAKSDKKGLAGAVRSDNGSFYDYLFA
ncbi:hypothetical protein BU15DRAFT_73281 [Melanogaster broomeanus]|nr:hypothetical protein BU15DRAFT_73281 [Melanogaster broomeanus]